MKELSLSVPPRSSLWGRYFLKSTKYAGYAADSPYMIVLIKGPGKTSLNLRKSEFNSCREYCTNDDVRRYISPSKAKNYDRWFANARVVFYSTGSKVNEKAELGTFFANKVEEYMGWEKTDVWQLKNKEIKGVHKFVYFEGPAQWIKAPATMSLYLLLLRLGFAGFSSSSIKKIMSAKKLTGIITVVADSGLNGDISRIRSIRSDLFKVLDNYDKLFGVRELADYWRPKNSLGYFLTNEGIQKLIAGNTLDSELKKAWANVR